MIRSNKNKFKNRKTVTVDGEKFDSAREARFYEKLKVLRCASALSDRVVHIDRQRKYVLIKAQRNQENKLLERECSYRADFVVTYADGSVVVFDVKGVRTPEYIMKRKLMLTVHGIQIQEV